MNLPSLRQLQFLDALAREKSFSRAAESMHVTQPTLSTAIRELEAILDTQLVEREARGATLTPVGVEVVSRARNLLSDAEDLVVAAKGSSEPLFGAFRLGAIPTIAPFILPRIMKHLKANYPSLTLYLREDQTARLLDDLRARRIDAALIALPYEANGIETEAVFEDFGGVGPGHRVHRVEADPEAGGDEIADLSKVEQALHQLARRILRLAGGYLEQHVPGVFPGEGIA